MAALFIYGVVKVAPVKMGVPPVAVVYQLNVAPDTVDDAVNIAVCPTLTACVDGVTVISGAGLTVSVAVARVVETAPVNGLIASA